MAEVGDCKLRGLPPGGLQVAANSQNRNDGGPFWGTLKVQANAGLPSREAPACLEMPGGSLTPHTAFPTAQARNCLCGLQPSQGILWGAVCSGGALTA